MAQHHQSNEELEEHLREQLHFLQASANAFDAGFEGEAKRIAVCIRVLVHDTLKSKSLLGQLGKKDQKFVDSSLPMFPGNMGAHLGLVLVSVVPNTASKYVAFLDDRPHGPAINVDFEVWWNTPVFIDQAGNKHSRSDLVLAVANKDGGAHVDPQLNATYADLSRNNSLHWMYMDGDKPVPMGGVELVALRQIGHEILKTLLPDYGKKPVARAGILVGGVAMPQGWHISVECFERPTKRKARPNDRCPCGSGVKFKKCCGV